MRVLKKFYQIFLLILAALSCGGVDMEELSDYPEGDNVEIVQEENESLEHRGSSFYQEVALLEQKESTPFLDFGSYKTETWHSPSLQKNPALSHFSSSNPPNQA